ncbi:hypothetical protein Tco_1006530 [Tanacetum coccineum]|uniref:Uncharacterized protein n=1 Tax=Tanacetum coccineum TaxID=301880 RepID=A0ABQ5FJW5_9ASTR
MHPPLMKIRGTNEEHEKEEEEYVDEFTDEEDNADNAKEENEEELDNTEQFYKDVNVNLRKEDVEMTDADQDKLLNFKNASPTENEIASLMDTAVRHEEPSDRYIGNKQGESIQQAIKSHTVECREEALVDRREYIDLIDTSMRAIIKEESTYEAATSLSEFELTKILMDKMEEHRSYLRARYKKDLYDALVKSYNTDKDIFETYGEVFLLKRSRDEKDKDHDPSAGSDRGTKRRKSSKDAESSRDPKSKESKSTSSSKGTSRSQHKSSGNLKIMNWYDYGHLDAIEVRREDRQLYMFKEGNFPRLLLQDIEDMLLLLVQQRLTNLTIDECYDLNVVIPMVAAIGSRQVKIHSHMLILDRQNMQQNVEYPRALLYGSIAQDMRTTTKRVV